MIRVYTGMRAEQVISGATRIVVSRSRRLSITRVAMNSFIGISKSQTTNLAVVAPGIAEALLATAIGLVAAIPAVIIYNHFARQTKTYLELVSRASGAAARLLSRDLDRTGGVMHSRAAE